jgi:hypothetical protein
MVEVVTAGEDERGAGVADGGGELGARLDPAVDGDAMDAAGLGGSGKGRTGGQGVRDAMLDRGQGR